MKQISLIGAIALLTGCNNAAPVDNGKKSAGQALDERAVAVGLMPDPNQIDLAGRFETRTDFGADKFCAIGSGDNFDIGFLSMSGTESKCEARGSAEVDGGKVQITLSGKGSCSFEASFDGIELRFPGSLEPGCASYCSPRTSFSGTHYFLIEPGAEAARKTLGREIERLCR